MTRTVGFLIWALPSPAVNLDGLLGRLADAGVRAVVDGSQISVDVASFDLMADEDVVEVTADVAGAIVASFGVTARCRFVGMPVATGMSVSVILK